MGEVCFTNWLRKSLSDLQDSKFKEHEEKKAERARKQKELEVAR